MGKKNTEFPPLLLAALSLLLLTGGWLMASFPLLVFVGISPLLALSEPRDSEGSIFEKMELVLIALTAPLVIHALVRDASVVTALGMGIVYTLSFVAHAWVRQTLGVRTGKITLILFWLALEYAVLKAIPAQGIFLADTLALQPDWTRWTIHTGYLGTSLWIIAVNWCWYLTFLQPKGIQWAWLGAGLLFLFAPAAYSYSLNHSPIARDQMINFYRNLPTEADVTYLARGELMVRTAAWLSILILLFTFVRQQIRK
ncbi:MAG: hypothetical protein JNN04_17700 [Cyclobacteriaceae bacterium]|nr:hypothetical protein [Cyclobacteriaceae bacterium]